LATKDGTKKGEKSKSKRGMRLVEDEDESSLEAENLD
jgi:hypothetical protein